jgi:squalene synthase HpnC
MNYSSAAAYNDAVILTENHYENFPVASFLIPKRLRRDVAIIYWFARTADDLADEGNYTAEERLKQLNSFEERLCSLLKGSFNSHFESALFETIKNNNLHPEYFFDLLSAFKQDVTKNRYSDFNELLDYCRRSANPVGRLMLQLFKIKDEAADSASDKICTALQLTNFYQDVHKDYGKGRIYFPQEELDRFNVAETDFQNSSASRNFKDMLKFNIDRAETMFDEGRLLLNFLDGRIYWEIKLTLLGGKEILKRIKRSGYDVFKFSPKLKKSDFIKIFLKSIYT